MSKDLQKKETDRIDKDTFRGLTQKETLDNLEALAVKVEEMIIRRPLSEQEIELRKESLMQKSINQSVLLEQLDEIKQEFKSKLDPLKMELKQIITDLKTRTKEEEGDVYHIPDYTGGYMCFFDVEGALISKRPLLPEEKKEGEGLEVKISRKAV